MPGVAQMSVDQVLRAARETHAAGVPWDNGSAGITLTWTIYDAGVLIVGEPSSDAVPPTVRLAPGRTP